MNYTPYRPGLGFLGTGLVLWLLGLLVPVLLPIMAVIGPVLILIGQFLFWAGVLILVIQLIMAILRGTP